MTIKQQGGIFGRNPTFNDVTVDGTLTTSGDLTMSGDLTAGDIEVTKLTGRASPNPAQVTIKTTDSGSGWSTSDPWGRLAFYNSDGSGGGPKIHATMDAISRASSGSYSKVSFKTSDVSADTLTENLRLEPNTKDVVVSNGNLVIETSGKGIDFSATSGTGTSELFNDYEEGSWQPVIGGVNTTSVAYYTKIGRVVYLTMDITSGGGASSASDITGLPYTPATMHGGMQVVYDSVSASSGGLGGYIDTSSPRITIRGNGGTSAVNIAAGERIMAFGFYLTS